MSIPKRIQMSIRTNLDYELVVIGGGVHGAAVANYAAQSGINTFLLEKNDFASGASSRSSKMAHGGLRYLEMFDFQQVFESIKCRESLFKNAFEFCKAHPFLIPVKKGDYWFKFKLGLGLKIYDLFLTANSRRHCFVSASALANEMKYRDNSLMGMFRYYDGILHDTELVMAHLNQAISHNASIQNYSEVTSLSHNNEKVVIRYRNLLSNKEEEITARHVINCSGAYSGKILMQSGMQSWPLRFSRGSHLIFNIKWDRPAMFLPLKSRARYYFVWPHPSGTMVGTTEREVAEPVDDPQASRDELTEILSNLKCDLPDSDLIAANAHYYFSGLRVLPARSNNNAALLSRRHVWLRSSNQVLSLFGGKLTSCEVTALQGLKILYPSKIKVKDDTLPAVFLKNIPLKEKIATAILKFKATTLEDLIIRRLYLDTNPDNGLPNISEILKVASENKLFISDSEVENYKNKIGSMRSIINSCS